MAYVCPHPEQYLGARVGGGDGVSFVQIAADAPPTVLWRQGAAVRGARFITPGTAIATFVRGRFEARPHGSQAAIFVSQDAHGIEVYDQGQGVAVRRRAIRFAGGQGSAPDDGDRFYVIE